MSESSFGWTTSNVGDGPSGGYSSATYTTFQREMFTTNPAAESVLYGIGGSLGVTGASSPVSVASGDAIVYGYPYRSDAATSVTIPTPTSATRIDRIVLRAVWSTQTVRITRIAGTEGGGTPALTQTANTTWDVPLANVSITTGGVITVSDQRTFVKDPGAYGWFTQALTVAGNFTAVSLLTNNSGAANDVVATYLNGSMGSDATLGSLLMLIRGIPSATGASRQGHIGFGDNSGMRDLYLNSNGAGAYGNVIVGANLTSLANITAAALKIDSTAYLAFSGANPILNFDGNDFVLYNRTTNIYSFYIGGTVVATLDSAGTFTPTAIGAGVVSTAALAAQAVTTAKLAANAVGAAQLAANAVGAAQLAANAVGATQLANGAVGTTQLAANAVDDTIAGNRIPQVYRRQGNDATNWAVPGTTNYTPGLVRIQAGNATLTFVSTTQVGISITFPVAFSSSPLVFVSANNGAGPFYAVWGNATSTVVGITCYSPSTFTGGVNVSWFAIGPQ
jgi:hypothetical protein